MAIDLSGGAFVDAFNKQETRLLARRAKNRDVYDKLMTDATDRGEKMTIDQITDLRTEMSNGNNFFTGYVPRGEVLENQITRQNKKADDVLHQETSKRISRETKQQEDIIKFASNNADGDITQFEKALRANFGEAADIELQSLGGVEQAYNKARHYRVSEIMKDQRLKYIKDKADVERFFPYVPKYAKAAILEHAKNLEATRFENRMEKAVTASFKLPEDIRASVSEGGAESKQLDTHLRGILNNYSLPTTPENIARLKLAADPQIEATTRTLNNTREDAFEQALDNDPQLQQLIASDAAPDVVDARIRLLAGLHEVGLPDDLNTSPQVRAFKDASLGSLKIADAAAYKASATSTQATYITLAGEKTEQAKANMAVAVLNIKKKAESGKNPAAMLAYTALNQFANSGYIPSDVNGAAQDAQALAEEAISQGMDVNEARTSIVNALINRGGTTTQSAMVATNMEVEIQRRHGIKPGTHIGYEGENGTYDKTVANAKELTDKLSKYFETVPSNKPERGEAQKTAAINNIKKVVSYLRDQLTENGHRFKGNRSEVEKQARELAERMAQAVQKIEDMQPSGAATTAVSLGASAMHSAVENGDAATVLAAITSNSATGNQALATANAEKIEALKQNVIEYAGVIQGVGPQAFAGLSRGEVDSKIMALSEALWNKLGKPNYATTSSIKDQFYMTLFGSLGITSEGNSYRLLSRQ